MDVQGLNLDVISAFAETVRYEADAYPEVQAKLVVDDPASVMDAPSGALKIASGSLADSGLHGKPAEGDVLWIGQDAYRVFDVKIDAGGFFYLALTQ